MEKSEIGRVGELIAARHLQSRGYKIIARNYRMVFGEIDIIAKCVDLTLVFVEVKTMVAQKGSRDGLLPEDQMTAHKVSKFKRIAEFYANKNLKLVNEEKGWRIDAMTVLLPQFTPGDSADFYSKATIRHYENI